MGGRKRETVEPRGDCLEMNYQQDAHISSERISRVPLVMGWVIIGWLAAMVILTGFTIAGCKSLRAAVNERSEQA